MLNYILMLYTVINIISLKKVKEVKYDKTNTNKAYTLEN
jgi:hypothetical protein